MCQMFKELGLAQQKMQNICNSLPVFCVFNRQTVWWRTQSSPSSTTLKNSPSDTAHCSGYIVQDLLLQRDPYKSMGWDSSDNPQKADWCHCKASLNDFWVVLGIQSSPSWLEAGKHCPVFKKGKTKNLACRRQKLQRRVGLTSVPGKVMVVSVGDIEKHKDNTVIGHS